MSDGVSLLDLVFSANRLHILHNANFDDAAGYVYNALNAFECYGTFPATVSNVRYVLEVNFLFRLPRKTKKRRTKEIQMVEFFIFCCYRSQFFKMFSAMCVCVFCHFSSFASRAYAKIADVEDAFSSI